MNVITETGIAARLVFHRQQPVGNANGKRKERYFCCSPTDDPWQKHTPLSLLPGAWMGGVNFGHLVLRQGRLCPCSVFSRVVVLVQHIYLKYFNSTFLLSKAKGRLQHFKTPIIRKHSTNTIKNTLQGRITYISFT